MGRLVLVLGGSRSGKSAFAEACVQEHDRVAYIATAPVTDHEMAERIRHHRERRPAHWHTIEEQLRVAEAIEQHSAEHDCLLVDCLTVWISNFLCDGECSDWTDEDVLDHVREFCLAASAAPANVLVVSNEVGCGIVPDNALSRRYRDLVGWANQIVAAAADEVHLLTAGIAQRLK